VNLICPARLILLAPGSRAFLTGERIAGVYATPAAEEPAAALAREVDSRLSLLPELTERQLQEIADQHRGETVVLVGPDLGFELPVVIEHEGDAWHLVPR
jgi:hypothetical protein